MTDDSEIFTAKLAEVDAELDATIAELEPARASVRVAAAAALAAGRRLNQISGRVTRAIRPDGVAAPALIEILNDARKVRDHADGEHTMSRDRLRNIEWRVENLIANRDQLRAVIDPLRPGRVEVVKRTAPQPEFVETIVPSAAGKAA